jgi:hypothetical protein
MIREQQMNHTNNDLLEGSSVVVVVVEVVREGYVIAYPSPLTSCSLGIPWLARCDGIEWAIVENPMIE